MPRRIVIALAVALALVVSATATLLAFAQDDSGTPATAPIVAALDQPRSVEDELPATAAQEMALGKVSEADVDRSVKALASGPWDLYLTPVGDDLVCLSIADETGGSGVRCFGRQPLHEGLGSPAGMIRTGCEVESPDAIPVCQDVTLYGVVPDGVSDVSVDLQAGPSRTATVQNNVYLLELPVSSKPSAVSYDTAAGTIAQDIPQP
jgi:hypothetical protein